MDLIFNDENADAVLLIDSENAFSSVNREVFIKNVQTIYTLLLLHLFQISIPSHLNCLLLEVVE